MYSLPNGKETESVEEHAIAWGEFVTPLANATGTVVLSFDPIITFAKSGQSGRMRAHIPTWFVAAFNEGLKEEK